MSDEPDYELMSDLSTLVSALEDLQEAQRECAEARAQSDGYSFDWSGHHSSRINNATNDFGKALRVIVEKMVEEKLKRV